MWGKRTILDALPDEAKNLDKQKAEIQRYRNKMSKSAKMTAAPKVENQIVMDTFGNKVSDDEYLTSKSLNNYDSTERKYQVKREVESLLKKKVSIINEGITILPNDKNSTPPTVIINQNIPKSPWNEFVALVLFVNVFPFYEAQ